jgi:hypothetical protein
MFFQHATEEEFRETIEHILGRKVRAFVSGVDVEQDVSTELFYLEPAAPTNTHPPDGQAG